MQHIMILHSRSVVGEERARRRCHNIGRMVVIRATQSRMMVTRVTAERSKVSSSHCCYCGGFYVVLVVVVIVVVMNDPKPRWIGMNDDDA